MRSLLLFLLLVGMAQAQVPITPFSYTGVVQQVTPGGVWLQTDQGVDVMLPQGLDFEVAGTHVNVGSLVPGNPCNVYFPGGQADLIAVDGDLCTLAMPTGPCQVPIACLPPDAMQKSKVAVLKNNGKVVNVPLNAALNMQRSQGARILGASNKHSTPWVPGQALNGVVCGYQDNTVLVLDGNNQIISVPRSMAGSLTPGRSIYVPAGNSFKVQSWVPSYKVKGNNGNGNWNGNGKGNNGKGKGKGKNK